MHRTTLLLLAVAALASAGSLNCRLVGSFTTPGYALFAAVHGDYAYVADNDSGLLIMNIADPASPYQVGRLLTRPKALHLKVVGDYAYVVCRDSGLRVINVANPAAPFQVGFRDTPYWALNVDVVGSHAYVADFVAGLRIINIANPASPYEAGFNRDVAGATSVRVVGNHAYVANAGGGLAVLNVSNPADPVYIAACSTTTYARSVAIADTFAYVADAQGGMHTISIAVPAGPRRLAVLPAGFASHVAVRGDYVYLSADSRLTVLDLADPQSPRTVAYYDLAGAISATPDSDLCYVATGTGISIIRLGLSGLSGAGTNGIERDLRVSPNPARDRARLECPTQVTSVAVIDAAGRVVRTLKPRHGTAVIEGLNPGVYLLRPFDDGTVGSARLVVR